MLTILTTATMVNNRYKMIIYSTVFEGKFKNLVKDRLYVVSLCMNSGLKLLMFE